MVKDSTVISVSITKNQANFLDDLKLSPSELLQTKIEEQKKIFDAVNQEKEQLLRNISNMQALLTRYSNFLEESGNFDKFTQYCKDVVQK